MAHMKNRDSNKRRREDRQVQAKVRQEAYDKLSTQEKLDKLGDIPAIKQRVKLQGQLLIEGGPRKSATLTVVPEVVAELNALADAPKKTKFKKGQKQGKGKKS